MIMVGCGILDFLKGGEFRVEEVKMFFSVIDSFGYKVDFKIRL